MTMSVNVMGGRKETWDSTITNAEKALVDSSDSGFQPDPKKKRTWKKPKDKPMRPLSAYNMFFQNQRERIVSGNSEDPTPEEIEESVKKLLKSKNRGPKKRQDRKSHGQISFGDLARAIAAKWKVIDPSIKAIYNKYAGEEKIRYKKEVVVWKEKKENEHDAMMSGQNSLLCSSTSLTDSVRSLATSSSASLSASLTSSFNPSDSISSTHGSSRTTQVDVIQRQQNILRQQMGFIDCKPHFRAGMYGGDNVVRQVPSLDRDRNTKPQGHQLNPSAGDDDINRNLSSGNANVNVSQASPDTMLESLPGLQQGNEQFFGQQQQQQQQPQLQNHQHQILLRLQQQQMRQLLELQKARDESSRMIDVNTTNMTTLLNQVLPTRCGSSNPQHSYSAQQLQPGNGTEAQRQWMSTMEQSEREQFRQLEEVTRKLDALKQQQRRMNQLMKDFSEMDDPVFADDGAVTHSSIQNTKTNNNNNNNNNFSSDFVSSQSSGFDRDFGGRQSIYGSFSGLNSVTSMFEPAGESRTEFEQNQDNGQRTSAFLRTETVNNVGIGDDFQNSNMSNQHFNDNSLRGLLQPNESVGGGEYDIRKQQERDQHMLQNRGDSLGGLLRIDGSMSGSIEDDNGMQHHQPHQNKLYDLSGFQQSQGRQTNEMHDDFESFLSR